MSRYRHPSGQIFKLEPIEARALADIFRSEAGLMFGDDAVSVLERKLRDRIVVLGLPSFTAYIELLRDEYAGRRELEEALELVTTHETYFYRQDYQLRAFRDQVLPQLRARTEVSKRLSIWSAGCSSGEEVYTIAMLVHSSGLFQGYEVRVLGSDISKKCITSARRALYTGGAFRAMPRELRRAYFIETEEGTMPIQELRDMCTFGQLNLAHTDRAAVVGQVDAIFCRNVIIYLDNDTRRRVIAMLYERLTPGGFLMLGHSESLLNVSSDFIPVHLAEDIVYRKPMPLEAGKARV
ncbi:MAG: CheR family methyltransferase [Polyangiaceae bacterium]